MSITAAPTLKKGQRAIRAATPADAGKPKRKRKSGIPTGNAGEYFVMGELLRRGFDAQLADRNTTDYDILVGSPGDQDLRKLQVKSVRSQPWYVKRSSFDGELLDQMTVYVLIGEEDGRKPVRYFMARNRDLAKDLTVPSTWQDGDSAFMTLKSLVAFEDRWSSLIFPKEQAQWFPESTPCTATRRRRSATLGLQTSE